MEIYYSFLKKFNVKLTETYGFTEVNGVFVSACNSPLSGFCHKTVEERKIEIMDDEDNECLYFAKVKLSSV